MPAPLPPKIGFRSLLGKTQTTQTSSSVEHYAISDPSLLDTSVLMDGEPPFVLRVFKGEESFSELYDFSAEMFLATEGESTATDFGLQKFLEKPVAVGVQRDEEWRWWHGIVAEFAQGDTLRTLQDSKEFEITFFRVRIRPKLWLLTLRQNCRVFQNTTTGEIISTILQEHAIDFKDATTQTKKKREYCVQYNETDFDFISRLMEDDGMFYFFDHTKSSHKMIVMDADGDFVSSGTDPLPYDTSHRSGMAARSVEACEKVLPTAHVTSDYFYENAATALVSGDKKVPTYTVYNHPGKYSVQGDGDELIKKRQASVDAKKKAWTVHTDDHMVRPGYSVTLTGHRRSDIDGVDCVVSHAIYELDAFVHEDSSHYGVVATFFDVSQPFVPEEKTPKPRIYGVQTAIVTGPDGEEICTDEYGRVHVKFHWDLSEAKNDDTSCWIRVAQGWAGATWGMFFVPRIGHEVVVSFINGNPDYPLITGCVYNQSNMPPYVPDRPERMGWKTATSKDDDGKGKKYNEWCFDDTAGEEEVYLHAQKDLNTVVHRGSRTALIEAAGDDEGHCDLVMERGSRTELLKEGNSETTLEKGDWVVTLSEGNNTLTLSQGDMEVSITGNQKTEISKNCEVSITKNYTLEVKGDVSINVTGKTSIESKGAMTLKSVKDVTIEGMNVNIKGQMNVSQEAGMMFDLKGFMVTVESDMMTEVKSMMTSVKGDTILQLDGSAMMQGNGGLIMLG